MYVHKYRSMGPLTAPKTTVVVVINFGSFCEVEPKVSVPAKLRQKAAGPFTTLPEP